MYMIAVCDDNRVHLSSLVQMIQAMEVTSPFEIDAFESWKTLLDSIEKRKYDIILLDILWGDEPAGIQAAMRIDQRAPDSRLFL